LNAALRLTGTWKTDQSIDVHSRDNRFRFTRQFLSLFLSATSGERQVKVRPDAGIRSAQDQDSIRCRYSIGTRSKIRSDAGIRSAQDQDSIRCWNSIGTRSGFDQMLEFDRHKIKIRSDAGIRLARDPDSIRCRFRSTQHRPKLRFANANILSAVFVGDQFSTLLGVGRSVECMIFVFLCPFPVPERHVVGTPFPTSLSSMTLSLLP
jgi:hypothetical protein